MYKEGKMILNNSNNISNVKKAVIFAEPTEIDGKYWFPYGNAIYSYDIWGKKITREWRFEISSKEKKRGWRFDSSNPDYLTLFCWSTKIGKTLVLSPYWAKDIVFYNTLTKEINFFDCEIKGNVSGYRNVVEFSKKLFVLPNNKNNDILVLQEKDKIKHIKISDWKNTVEKWECTAGYTVQGKYLWVTAHYSNQVLKLDMETEQYEWITIEEDAVGYTGIKTDGEYMWLAESHTGAIIKYSIYNRTTKRFNAPASLNFNSSEKGYVYLELFDFEKYIITIPALCDKMTILNKKTDELNVLDIDFFDSVINSNNNYMHGNFITSSFGKKIDENTLWVQRAIDGEIAVIDIETLTYKTFSLGIEYKFINDMYAQRYFYLTNGRWNEKDISLNLFLCYQHCSDNNKKQIYHSGIGAEIWEELIQYEPI